MLREQETLSGYSFSTYIKSSEKLALVCVSGVKYVSFSENFTSALNEWALDGIPEERRGVFNKIC